MYFLWKRTPYGSIRVSRSGLSGFLDRVLTGKSRCRSLLVTEGECASITLVLFSDDSAAKGTQVEERISSIMAPLGFQAKVIWADRPEPNMAFGEGLSSLMLNSWFWMLLVSMLVLGIIAGLKGLFWTLFWGTAAWFVSKAGIFFLVGRKSGFLPPTVRR